MQNWEEMAGHYLICPFCFYPSDCVQFIRPDNWNCPVCDFHDPEWNFMMTCSNCGHGPRLLECPHCREDFDSMRLLMSFGPYYMDYIRIEKIHSATVAYRLGDIDITISDDKKDINKGRIENLISDVVFDFPGMPNQLHMAKIYNIKEDRRDKGKTWISMYLYDEEGEKTETDVGQLVLLSGPGNRVLEHKVVDVARSFLFKAEALARELGRIESVDSTDLIFKEKVNTLIQYIKSHDLKNERDVSTGRQLARECLQATHTRLLTILEARKTSPADFWKTATSLGDLVVRLDMAIEDMPWHGSRENKLYTEVSRELNTLMAMCYYNQGIALCKLEEFQNARIAYKKAAFFEPEPELSLMLHRHWAEAIKQQNNHFRENGSKSQMELISEYCEMIAHFDEVVKEYEKLTDAKVRQTMEMRCTDAKAAIKNALELEGTIISCSTVEPDRLVLRSPESGGKAIPIRDTWARKEISENDMDGLTENQKISIVHGHVGLQFLEKKRFDEAIVELRKALKANPDNFRAMNSLGSALQSKKHFSEAIALFKKAMRKADSNEEKGVINYNLGNAYKDQDKFNEAIPYYQTAIKLEAGGVQSASRYFNLGQCYLGLHRFEEAIPCYKKALSINPGHANAMASLKAAEMLMGADIDLQPDQDQGPMEPPGSSKPDLNLLEEKERRRKATIFFCVALFFLFLLLLLQKP